MLERTIDVGCTATASLEFPVVGSCSPVRKFSKSGQLDLKVDRLGQKEFRVGGKKFLSKLLVPVHTGV